jgi:hypothetical protein
MVAASVARAQATRTWVSGVGDDANPCSRTAPCKTWAGAISKTAAGGEIDALDPGGFGALTITKAIVLDGGGNLASTLVAGTNGIVIAANATDNIILRRIAVQGLGQVSTAPGLNGIRFISGNSLTVENCVVQNFSQIGIDFEPNQGTNSKLNVIGSTVSNVTSHGIFVKAFGGGQATASISDSKVLESGASAIRVEDHGSMSVRRTMASNGKNGFVAAATSAPSSMEIDDCQATENTNAGITAGFGGSPANIRVSNSLITNNAIGLSIGANGAIVSWGNNHLAGNTTTDGAFTSTISPQ